MSESLRMSSGVEYLATSETDDDDRRARPLPFDELAAGCFETICVVEPEAEPAVAGEAGSVLREEAVMAADADVAVVFATGDSFTDEELAMGPGSVAGVANVNERGAPSFGSTRARLFGEPSGFGRVRRGVAGLAGAGAGFAGMAGAGAVFAGTSAAGTFSLSEGHLREWWPCEAHLEQGGAALQSDRT